MRQRYARFCFFHRPFIGVLLPALVIFGLLACKQALAFSEDICWQYTKPNDKSKIKPEPFNCWDMQCVDPETGLVKLDKACAARGLKTYIETSMLGVLHGRSVIHYDAVWLIARLLGMKYEDANTLAAYSEATDPGAYSHYDLAGHPSTEPGTSTTDNILGAKRDNESSYGFWFHYVPWYRLPGSSDRSHLTYHQRNDPSISPFAQVEVPLNHLHAWAFKKRSTLCEFGILSDPLDATSDCPNENGGSKMLHVELPVMAGQSTPIGDFVLSWQRMNLSDNCAATDNMEIHDTCFNRSWAADNAGSLRALAIYIHAMGDRLSHFACVDPSGIQAPSADNPNLFRLVYSPQTCGYAVHALLHYRETGHKPIPSRSKTTIAYAIREINNWMTAMNYPRETPSATPAKGYPDIHNEAATVEMIARAAMKGSANDRLSAFCTIAVKGYGLAWNDGNTSCRYP